MCHPVEPSELGDSAVRLVIKWCLLVSTAVHGESFPFSKCASVCLGVRLRRITLFPLRQIVSVLSVSVFLLSDFGGPRTNMNFSTVLIPVSFVDLWKIRTTLHETKQRNAQNFAPLDSSYNATHIDRICVGPIFDELRLEQKVQFLC